MRFNNLFLKFVNSEKAGGLILLGCTVVALFIANSAGGDGFVHFWHRHFNASFSVVQLNLSGEQWVNDGLMAIFFLLVGLEIERELYIGELAQLRNAVLPIAGAVGGMLVPVLVYLLFNAGTHTVHGFGIPMATDIAFALGMLALVGNRIPHALKIFLTALAIIDDLGAILVIAFFYNSGISLFYLGLAAGVFAILLLLNRLNVTRLWLYLVLGVVLWYFMLRSGVHATISGVLLAFAIPFGKDDDTNISYQLQHVLHKPVAFFILPLFALANTGIQLEAGWMQNLTTSTSIGVFAGLVFGKPIGIVLFAALMVWLRWGKLGEGVTWSHIAGAGLLGGIGFTMSIFIANLAFENAAFVQQAKIAILLASLVASCFGIAMLRFSIRSNAAKPRR